MNDYAIGFTACYINDHPFQHITDVHPAVALVWVKKVLPDADLGTGKKAKDVTLTQAIEDGWLNKLFIIVGHEHGKWVALYKHDDKFSIRVG